jgi:hypothetical protein
MEAARTGKTLVHLEQGDPIGRILAHWLIIYFLTAYRSSPRFGATFATVEIMH